MSNHADHTDITVSEAHRLHVARAAMLLDVREKDEWDAGHIDGAVHVPLGALGSGAVDLGGPIIAVCRSGNRSGTATEILRAAGADVRNMSGGMLAWAREGLPVVAADGSPGEI